MLGKGTGLQWTEGGLRLATHHRRCRRAAFAEPHLRERKRRRAGKWGKVESAALNFPRQEKGKESKPGPGYKNLFALSSTPK